MYKPLGSDVIDEHTNFVVPESGAKNAMLWHQRIRHIAEKCFQILHGNSMVEGMRNVSLDLNFREHCVYGKQNKVSFPFGARREKGILELVHSDVFGPMSIPSLGIYVYYVSFIDDFSSNTCIYFLKNKFKYFHRFK